jgi:hypothetical protein
MNQKAIAQRSPHPMNTHGKGHTEALTHGKVHFVLLEQGRENETLKCHVKLET